MSSSVVYPQRQPFFAHRYCRLLTKTCAAQDIGHIAFVLCVTIAHQEDAKRYKGAVTFFNEQIMPLIGVSKWDALDRARKRAVKACWLHYEPGNRGQRQPGRYWVTIPDGLDDFVDTPCDETQYPPNGNRDGEWIKNQYPAKGNWVESQSPTQSPTQPPANGDREGERRGDREGELSTLSLKPSPKKSRAAKIKNKYTEAFEKFWSVVAPHKRKSKAEAFKRYREATKALIGQHEDPQAFLLDRAAAYYASPEGQTQYASGPAPWLHQARYEDDPTAWERDDSGGKSKQHEPAEVPYPEF